MAVLLLARVGGITRETLVRNVGYAALLVVTWAAIVTPTYDLMTLSVVSVPLFTVYGLSVLLAWGFGGSTQVDVAGN